MKKLIFSILFIPLVSLTAFGQTLGQYTQWSQNHFLVNPAAAGNNDHLNVNTGFRRQWAGIKDAPRMFYANGHMALNQPKVYQNSAMATSKTTQQSETKRKLSHALGLSLNGSEFGAFNRKDILATYALHLPINREYTLAFGLSTGLSNFSFNSSKSDVLLENDPTYAAYAAGNNANSFTSDFGTYLYHENFYFGYAARQLLNTEVDLTDGSVDQEGAGQQTTHLFMGGYQFALSNNFMLKPNLLVKATENRPISYDFNTTLHFRESLYLGAAYRSGDAASILLGMNVNQMIRFGYAYDVSLSEIKTQSSGSHEILIGLRLF